jgi:hypothetical protein
MARLFCKEAGDLVLAFTMKAFMDRSEAIAWLENS